MRALRYVVLPDESAADFHALEEAMVDELAPVGAVQAVLARRVAVAAWRLARADRMEVELFEERRWEDAGVGMALIRDGNGTRSFETLMRYRGAAMAEFIHSLRTLKALQAEQAREHAAGAELVELPPRQPRAPARLAPRAAARPKAAHGCGPNEPKRHPELPAEHRLEYLPPDAPGPGSNLHEPVPSWMPNEPEPAPPLPPTPALPVAQRAATRTSAGALTPSAAAGGASRTAPGR
jgi:hypothetical protein